MASYRTAQRIGRILRFSAVTLVYAVCLLLLLRMCSARTPAALKGLDPNETLKDAYAESETLSLLYQNGDTITRAEPSKGYFAIPEYYYIPEAKQVQLIFRYNNSTLSHLQEDYKLADAPTREGDWYDLTLVLKGESEARIHATKVEKSLSKRLYTFYRITFDNVVIDENTTGLFADVYYKGDVDYEKSAYGTLCLYDPADAWLQKKLSAGERRALSK